MDLNHICFIVPNYPTENEPVYTFVSQLVKSISNLGIKCTVIAPQSLTKILLKKRNKRPFFWQDITDKGTKIDIYQPSYFSLSKLKLFGMSISTLLSQRAIIKTFKKININPDVLYGHFWHSGVKASIIGKKYDIPVFVATGESKIWVNDLYRENILYKNLKHVLGAICVSSKNMQESIDLQLVSKDRTTVIPNAINNKLFYPIEKTKARRNIGFKEKDFIVAYTGAFNHRKGVLRLSEALNKLEDIKAIYIGSGDLKPYGESIIFEGRLPHNKIVNYLNAADIFVLPTLAEGCCNAIIEAMACGLPIVSSDLSFNDDILDEHNSIRVDSNNIDQIANAIQYLKNNPEKCKKMSNSSLRKASELEICNRSHKILDFITSRLDMI